MSNMHKIKARHADAIDRFGKHYKPKGNFGKPTLAIGNQSFALDHEPDPKYDDEYLEWLGWMLCAALKTLVDEHQSDRIDALEAENEGAMALIAAERGEVIALRAENARLREALESISTYRKRCHDYDSDVGHEMRDFNREDVRLLEIEARAALKGGK